MSDMRKTRSGRGEALRSPDERMRELLRLHDQLNAATCGSIGRSARWVSLYRRFITLPPPLEASLSLIHLLGYRYSDGGRAKVEDLIVNGEYSEIYGDIRPLWQLLGEDKNQQITWGGVTERLSTLASYDGDCLYTLCNPSSPYQVLNHFIALRDEMGGRYLFTEVKWALEMFRSTSAIHLEVAKEIKNTVLSERERFYGKSNQWLMESRLFPIILALGTITLEKMSNFLSLAEEYNLEWALSSFEWSEEGRANSPLGRLQAIVDESPWSEEMARLRLTSVS